MIDKRFAVPYDGGTKKKFEKLNKTDLVIELKYDIKLNSLVSDLTYFFPLRRSKNSKYEPKDDPPKALLAKKSNADIGFNPGIIISSIPTDNLSNPSVTPNSCLISKGIDACVIVAGCVIIVSTEPKLSAKKHNLTLFIRCFPAGIPPFNSKDIIPE